MGRCHSGLSWCQLPHSCVARDVDLVADRGLPLSRRRDDQPYRKEKVEKKLLETTQYETFEMNYVVDESLIGGMVIRIGDRVVDSSIKTKLYNLSRELRNIQV